MATTIKSRFPLLMLLGIIFLASVCVTYANYDEGTEPRVPEQRERGRQEGEKEEKHHGELRPSYEQEEEEEEHRYHYHHEKTGQRERGHQRGHQEGEKEEKRHGEWIPSYEKEEYEKKTQPGRERWDRKQDEKEVEERGRQHTEPRVPGQRERGRQEGEKAEKRHGEWIPSYGKEEDEEEKHRYHYHPEKAARRERGRQEGEKEEKRHGEWIPSYEKEEYEKKAQPGRERWDRKQDEEEVEERGSQPTEPRVPGQRERGRQEGEKEEKRRGEWIPSYEKEEQNEIQRGRERWEKVEYEEPVEEQWRGIQRHEDPDERARERYRAEIAKREVEKERHPREEYEEEGSSKSKEPRNPFLFKSNKFLTLFENENGYIRRLQRFDERSDLFENLQNYRLVEYRAKPHTIFLPQHVDADLILTVLSGKAILTVLSPNDRDSYNLERGDTIKIPAGTTSYLVNQDDEEDLRVVDLAIPVNKPGKFEAFDLSKNKNQYLRGFSKKILEASLNTKYETIERVLLGERRQQGQERNAIVKVSREQIAELRKLAKSSLRKILPSEFEPFNLRRQNQKYSNNFGKLFEITPEHNPQLQDLNIFVSSVEINEGALMLPHYNSRAIVVLFLNEGKGNLELVGFENEQHEREDKKERNTQVQRYDASLSPGDVVIIPAGHPVAISASSNLNLIGFGINGENNQRNFLTGSDDNVISQIENPVKDLTFPGSAQEVNRLLKNQKESHFANAQPAQKEEESQRQRSPLSSILNTFY